MKKIAVIFLAIIMLVGCGKEQTIKHPLVKNTQKKETKKDDTQKQIDASNTKIDVPLFVESKWFILEKNSNESPLSDTNQDTADQEEGPNITNDPQSNIIFPNARDEQIPSNRAPNSSNLQSHALWPKLLEGYDDEKFIKNTFILDNYAFVTRSGIIGTEPGYWANKTVSLYDLDADKYLWHKKMSFFDMIVPGKIIRYTFEGDKKNQTYFIDFLTGQELRATTNLSVSSSDGTYFTGIQHKDKKYNKVIGLIDTGEIIISDASKYISDEEPIVVKKRVFQDDQGKEHVWDYEKTYSKVEQRLIYFEEDNKLLVASNSLGNDYLFNLRMIDTISGKIDWSLKADLNFFHTVDDLKLLNIEKNGDYYFLYTDGYRGVYGEDSDREFFLRVCKNGDAFELNKKYKFVNYYKGNLIVRDYKQIDAYNLDGQKIKTLVKPDLAYNSKVCAGKIFLFTKSLTCYDGITLEELWDKKFDSSIHPELTDIIVSDRIYTIISHFEDENYSNVKSALFEIDPASGETIDKIVFDDPSNDFPFKPSILSTQHSIIIHSQFGLHVFKDKSNQKAIKPSKRFIGDYDTHSGSLSPNEKYSLENTTDRDMLVTQRIFSYNTDNDATYKVKVPAKKKIDILLSQFKQLTDDGLHKIVFSFENDFDQVMINCGQHYGD